MESSDYSTSYSAEKLKDESVRNRFFGLDLKRRGVPTSEHLYEMLQQVLTDLARVPELEDGSDYADFKKWYLRVSVALRANKLGYLLEEVPTLGWELISSALIADVCKTTLGKSLVVELSDQKLFLNELVAILTKKYPKPSSTTSKLLNAVSS